MPDIAQHGIDPLVGDDFNGCLCLCGNHMEWAECWDCGGEGYHDDLYEQDPLWYDQDDIETCSTCQGKGGHWYCPSDPDVTREV